MRVTTRSAKATIQTGDTDVVSLLCSARSALRLVTPISPHPARARLAFSHRHGEPCVTRECPTRGAGNAHGISAVAAARSCLRRVSPATSWPRGPMESCWRWTASSAPALSARSRQATRIVRPQPQRMVRSRRDRARHWRACSRSMMPLLPALCGARESPAAITRALALSCTACVPPDSAAKTQRNPYATLN